MTMNAMAMAAEGKKPTLTKGDVVWLSAMRNSLVSASPLYRRTLENAQRTWGRQRDLFPARERAIMRSVAEVVSL